METLQKRAQQRKVQTDKHGQTEIYQPDGKVWLKLHRRSDAKRRLTRKIHLVYDGPYKIRNEIRKNAYLLEDSEDNVAGTFNSRQLKPHHEPKLKPSVDINVMETEKKIPRINLKLRDEFVHKLKRANQKHQNNMVILNEDPETANREEPKYLKRKKKQLISEKSRKHISRMIDIISGKK